MEFLSKSTEETKQVATEFAGSLKSNQTSATIVGLYGELGAGKTTFMKYLAEYFGAKETVQSPTFVIMKIYQTSPRPRKLGLPLSLPRRGERGEVFRQLIHIDAYRFEDPSEMLKLGWQEMIDDPKNLICIEWPERIAPIMPESHIRIIFEHISENERKITIEW